MLAPVVLALLGWFTPLGGPGVSVRIGTSIMQQNSAATASTSASFAEKKEALKDCLRREAKKQTALRAQQAHSPQQAAATSLAHIHLAGHACVSPPPLFFTLPRLSPAFYCETTCFCETPPVIARPHLLLRDPTCYCETPPVIARPTCHHLPRFQRVTPNVAPVATLPASCCVAQYASFFQPMETQFYAPNVQFFDPLINLEGVDAYQNNVGMLAGKSHTSLTQVSHKSHTSLTHKSHTQVSHTSLTHKSHTQVSHKSHTSFSPHLSRGVFLPHILAILGSHVTIQARTLWAQPSSPTAAW